MEHERLWTRWSTVTDRPPLLGAADSRLTAADQAAVRRFPELHRLITLRNGGGWFFRPFLVRGELELVAGARLWPDGWSDAIAIRDIRDTCAFRCDPAGGAVWNRDGGLTEVVDGLVELPAPDEPGAPRLVKARAPKLWTPGPRPGMKLAP